MKRVRFFYFESLTAQAVKDKQQFQRLVMKKEDLLKMFEYNIFKQRIINEKYVLSLCPCQ